MKKKLTLFTLTLVFIACVQKDQMHYEQILSSLTKNYTSQGGFDNFTQICWKVTYKEFLKDSIEYENCVNEFYKQEREFLLFLIKYKDDIESNNYWIVKRNPCKSKVSASDFINNSKGALILIDNLLVNDNKESILINDYVDDIKFEHVEKIIRDERSLEAIKPKYIKYIESIK